MKKFSKDTLAVSAQSVQPVKADKSIVKADFVQSVYVSNNTELAKFPIFSTPIGQAYLAKDANVVAALDAFASDWSSRHAGRPYGKGSPKATMSYTGNFGHLVEMAGRQMTPARHGFILLNWLKGLSVHHMAGFVTPEQPDSFYNLVADFLGTAAKSGLLIPVKVWSIKPSPVVIASTPFLLYDPEQGSMVGTIDEIFQAFADETPEPVTAEPVTAEPVTAGKAAHKGGRRK